MGLEEILRKIEMQRDAEIVKIRKEQNRESTDLRAGFRKEMNEEKETMKADIEKEREIFRNLKLSEAKRNVKREHLAEKERLINNTLKKVLSQFVGFKGKRYERLLDKFMREGAEMLEGKCIIHPTRSVDVPFLKGLRVAPVSSKTVKGSGGAVLVSRNGEFRIDRTFDYLIEKKGSDLRKMIAEILFEEE